jgi:hypothetical protein
MVFGSALPVDKIFSPIAPLLPPVGVFFIAEQFRPIFHICLYQPG